MAELKAKLDYTRVGEAINVILTDIYGEYVAMGSPTKLGGLRFLDVQCSKTFAFEKTVPAPELHGNLLILSAPAGDAENVEKEMRAGPYGKHLKSFDVRSSSDAGKGSKKFVEVSYLMPTGEWLNEKIVTEYAKKHNLTNGNEIVTWILRDHVLPMGREIMALFVKLIRAETVFVEVKPGF